MDAQARSRLLASPAFRQLVVAPLAVSLVLTAALFVLYYGYILLVAVNKPLLATRIGEVDARSASRSARR